MSYPIKYFQKKYSLSNKEMSEICNCSLPTIQKWRSGEVSVSGAAGQLMKLLDHNAEGDPDALRGILHRLDEVLEFGQTSHDPELEKLHDSMNQVVDRLEFMLENRRKEKERLESEARYRSIVDSYDIPVARWLPDTTLTFVNKAYAKLFKRFGSDLVGRKWLEFLPESVRAETYAIVSDMVRRGDQEVAVNQHMGPDGTRIDLEWRNFPIKDMRGVVMELHSIAYDVTELVKLRNEVRECSSTRDSFLSLIEDPAVEFDASGLILHHNQTFVDQFLADGEITGFGDLLTGRAMGKFKRLLSRIQTNESFCYQLQLKSGNYRMNGRLIGRSEENAMFAGIFVKLGAVSDNQVTQVRLKHELILAGRHNELKLNNRVVEEIQDRMNQIGKAVSVDRIYVFTFDNEDSIFDNLLEWCADGVTPYIDELQAIPMDDYPWWINRLRKNQWIQFADTSKMPRSASRERELLVAQGIRSIMIAPLIIGGEVMGFTGFDHNHSERFWHEQESAVLTAFKEELEAAFASALVTQSADQNS